MFSIWLIFFIRRMVILMRSALCVRPQSRSGTLELKQRIAHIATILEGFLDPDFRVAARQITTALPPPLDPTKTDDDFGDFIFAPLGEYVVRHGMERKCLKTSLKTLKALTQRFSMEDAIRHFINTYPDETLAELDKWSDARQLSRSSPGQRRHEAAAAVVRQAIY